MSEYNKKGVVLDHNFPVMPIILMVFALICRFIPLATTIKYEPFSSFFFSACMLLIFAGIVLHRVRMQVLTGIGTLAIAATQLYAAVIEITYIARYDFESGSIYNIIIELLCVAAFTVAGLHYVLRRPRPGKAPKLILMIPLSCLLFIDLLVRVIKCIGYYNPIFIICSGLASIFMAFALMIYTPFRRA